MSVDIVDAQWTTQHARRMAKEELMLIRGTISGEALHQLKKEYAVENPVQVAPSESNAVAAGHCYCGKVVLELPLDIKPAISVICHCHDCREWHSVGSLPYMMFPLNVDEDDGGSPRYRIPIRLLSSPENLAYVHRTPEVRRWYAICCGTRLFNSVYNEKVGLKLCGTFPTVFPEYKWVPTMHVNVRESNSANYPLLKDTKWADLPADFGGTGKKL